MFKEFLGLFFVFVFATGVAGCFYFLYNKIFNKKVHTSVTTAFYEGLVILSIICLGIEKTDSSIHIFKYLPYPLILICMAGCYYIASNQKISRNSYLLYGYGFLLLAYIHWFIVYTNYPLRDIFQDIHFYKGALEFSRDSVLNLNTANSYIPIFQSVFGLSHKLVHYDMITMSWLSPLLFGWFGVAATYSIFTTLTRNNTLGFICLLGFILNAQKSFLSHNNNNILYFYFFILINDLIQGYSARFYTLLRAFALGPRIHRAATLLIPTLFPFFFYRKTMFPIRVRALASKVDTVWIFVLADATIVHFFLWIYLYLHKPTYLNRIIELLNILIYKITDKNYLLEILHRQGSNLFSLKNMLTEWIREFSPLFCVLIIILTLIYLFTFQKRRSGNFNVIVLMSLILCNLMIFLPIPNITRGRIILNFFLLFLFSYTFLRIKNKKYISLGIFTLFVYLALAKYSIHTNMYTQSYYSVFYVFCALYMASFIWAWKRNYSLIYSVQLIFLLAFDKVLITAFFFSHSYGDTAHNPIYHRLNAISHYNMVDYTISDYLPSNPDTILFSDPATLAIVKARTGYNGFISFENIGNGMDEVAEHNAKDLFLSHLNRHSMCNQYTDCLDYFIKNPAVITQETSYAYKKKHLPWDKMTLEKNLVFIVTPRTLVWLGLEDKDLSSNYYPISIEKLKPINLLQKNKILHQDSKLIIFKL